MIKSAQFSTNENLKQAVFINKIDKNFKID